MTYEESLFHYQTCERLINERVWATVRATGYEFDELRSKASEVFMHACETYDESRATKFSTWLSLMLNGHLLNYAKKMRRELPTIDIMLIEEFSEISAFHSAQLHDEIAKLSEEAQHVCKIILDGPADVLHIADDLPAKMIRGAIVAHLREIGYSRPRAWDCIREIKQMLETL